MFYFSIQEVKKIQVVDNLMYVLNREVRETDVDATCCMCRWAIFLTLNVCIIIYVKFLDLINSIRIIRHCRAVIK